MLQGNAIRYKVIKIQHDLHAGLITYDKALTLLRPIITQINANGSRLAKKYHKQFKPLQANYLLR